MIKKLRRKFILISMLSILAVLVVIMTSISAVNYYKLVSEADSKIELISTNVGVPDDFKKENGASLLNSETWEERPTGGDGMNPFPNDKGMQEARYFCIFITSDEDYIFDDNHIASVSESEAISMASSILKKSKTKGFNDVYRYQVFSDVEENVVVDGVKSKVTYQYKIIFLDCRESISSFKNFVITCSWVSAVGLLAFFILVFLLSIKVFMPVKKSYEKQKRFITNASHELKTPLTIISANNEILELEYGENEYSKSIDKQIKRMTSMVNNLTMLARLDEADKIEKTNCNLTSLCYEAIDTYTPVFKTSEKKFTYDIAEGVDLICDQKLMSQLVALILDNANKYSLTFVNMTLLKTPKEIIFSVENDADVKENDGNIFLERFYRSSEARKTKEGSGIGLSLVKEIVDLHKASLDINVENNKFKITIKFR